MDIKWNQRARGRRTEEAGNCRGPGTQEERLIQLIGDPVPAPAVPRRLCEYPREVESRMEGMRGLGHLAIPSHFWPNPSLHNLALPSQTS